MKTSHLIGGYVLAGIAAAAWTELSNNPRGFAPTWNTLFPQGGAPGTIAAYSQMILLWPWVAAVNLGLVRQSTGIQSALTSTASAF